MMDEETNAAVMQILQDLCKNTCLTDKQLSDSVKLILRDAEVEYSGKQQEQYLKKKLKWMNDESV